MSELVVQGIVPPVVVFDKVAAEAEKSRISKVIRPDKQLTALPLLLSKARRVLLVVPPGTIEESYGRLSAAGGELPMLGLAFIAASLRDQGHIVKIIDYEVNDLPMSVVERDVRAFQPDIVGMTAYITNMKRCGRVAKIVKEVSPDIKTILGGPQVTIFPDEAFHSSYIDMIALSEAEIIIRNVMNALGDEEKLSRVKGIWFRSKAGDIVKNAREGLVDELDLFPSPALDLYEMDKYFPTAHIQGRRVAHLLTSRGCPFKCTFCETKLTFGRSFRYHSTQRVLAEIEQLVAKGFDSFQFYDDIFTANKKRVIELCDGIIQKNWNIKWMCFTRTNCVSDELLARMKEAGCYLITYGGESGDDELLALIKKDLTVATNYKGIAAAQKHGIKTMSSFMLGLPTETREQSMKTIDFALDSGLDYAIFPITEPYPGTELWVDAKKFGHFDDSGKYKNGLLSENAAVWIPHNRTREELEELAHLGMRKFYLRPRQLWQVILNFFELPPGRAIRYVVAGFSYFFANRFKSSQAGTRY
jgi:anaerobic magnesium-protoporphyrin IX monomethyl ester cyclase